MQRLSNSSTRLEWKYLYSLRAEHDILNTTNYCCCASILTIHPRTKHVYTSRSAMLNLYRWFHKKVSLYTKYNYIPMCKAYICNSSCSGTWCWDPHDALRDVAKILVLVWIDYRWGIWTLISRQNLKLFFGLESFFLLKRTFEKFHMFVTLYHTD